MLIVGGIGLKYGNPERLGAYRAPVGARVRASHTISARRRPRRPILARAPFCAVYGTDYQGHVCGVDTEVKGASSRARRRSRRDFSRASGDDAELAAAATTLMSI